MDDIRQKLQEKKENQMMELRRIEDDIAAGRIERPRAGQNFSQPIPGTNIFIIKASFFDCILLKVLKDSQ